MGQKWYKSRMIQAATVAALGAIIAALVTMIGRKQGVIDPQIVKDISSEYILIESEHKTLLSGLETLADAYKRLSEDLRLTKEERDYYRNLYEETKAKLREQILLTEAVTAKRIQADSSLKELEERISKKGLDYKTIFKEREKCKEQYENIKKISSEEVISDNDFFKKWLVITGRWEITKQYVKYLGPDDPNTSVPHGIILYQTTLWQGKGSIETNVNFLGGAKEGSARILFAYNSKTREYYTAGLGGHGYAYCMSDFRIGEKGGWYPIKWMTDQSSLENFSEYKIRVSIISDKACLYVNDIKIFEVNLPKLIDEGHVGFFTWGPTPIEFKNFNLSKNY